MTQPGKWLLALVVALTLPAMGCSSEITEEDLQLWTHNEVGFTRLGEVILDTTQPMNTRVRAAEVAVEKGMGSRVRSWAADMKTEDRNTLLAGLIKELLDHMEKKDDHQYASKDALLLLERYIAPDEFTGLQEKIAAWAFGDWTWDLSAEEVKKKLESRMSTGQIRDLGPYGWKGGAILISHGYVVDKMLEILTAAEQPEATDLMLKGLRKYHTNIGVRTSHLDALSKTKSSDAAIYVLDSTWTKRRTTTSRSWLSPPPPRSWRRRRCGRRAETL